MVPPVTVYWRPGCPYCRRLRGDLRRIGLPAREVNIWEDGLSAVPPRAPAGRAPDATGGMTRWLTMT